MTTLNNRSLVRMAIILAALPAATFAHHSVRVSFDTNRPLEVEGEIIEVRWQNPHMHFTMRAVVDGVETSMDVEAIPATRLARVGLSPEILEVGATVSAFGFPSRSGGDEMYATNLLLADGREVLLDTPTPRWTNTTIGTGMDTTPGERGADRSLGLFRVWSTDAQGFSVSTGGRITAAALEAREQWDPLSPDNPFPGCTAKGMPTIMGQPNPMEFVDRGEEILIRIEEYDTVRVINMREPQEQPGEPILLGHSFGRWEGDTLVVTTTGIDWRNFSQDGLMQSEAMEVIERFRINDDGSRLEYEQTLIDPWLFTEPFIRTKTWVWVPGDQVRPYECAAG